MLRSCPWLLWSSRATAPVWAERLVYFDRLWRLHGGVGYGSVKASGGWRLLIPCGAFQICVKCPVSAVPEGGNTDFLTRFSFPLMDTWVNLTIRGSGNWECINTCWEEVCSLGGWTGEWEHGQDDQKDGVSYLGCWVRCRWWIWGYAEERWVATDSSKGATAVFTTRLPWRSGCLRVETWRRRGR